MDGFSSSDEELSDVHLHDSFEEDEENEDYDNSSRAATVSSEEDEDSDDEFSFCNLPFPRTYSSDHIEKTWHEQNGPNVETNDGDISYRTRATGDTDSLLLLGTAPVFNNVIDSASPDGSVFNFSSVIRRTKTERGGRTTLFFDREHPVPNISGKLRTHIGSYQRSYQRLIILSHPFPVQQVKAL
jgi:hypothetical protein